MLLDSDSVISTISESDFSEENKVFTVHLNRKKAEQDEKSRSSIPLAARYVEPDYSASRTEEEKEVRVHRSPQVLFVKSEQPVEALSIKSIKPASRKPQNRLTTPYRDVKIHDGVFRRKYS